MRQKSEIIQLFLSRRLQGRVVVSSGSTVNTTTKNVVTQNVAEGDTIDTNDMPFHIINHGTINITVNK